VKREQEKQEKQNGASGHIKNTLENLPLKTDLNLYFVKINQENTKMEIYM